MVIVENTLSRVQLYYQIVFKIRLSLKISKFDASLPRLLRVNNVHDTFSDNEKSNEDEKDR